MLQSIAESVRNFIASVGYPGLFLLIVLESTMVPIPSLLVMPFAGYLASTGTFSLPVILAINALAALTGSALSYWLGAAGGKPLLLRYGKYVFVRPKDLEKTHEYFERHGGKTIFVGRFLPVVRHLISIPAGIARMPLPRFLTLTFLGATIWGGGLMVLGYQLGANWSRLTDQASHVDHLVAGLVVLAIVAIAVRFVLRRRRERAETATPPAKNPETVVD